MILNDVTIGLRVRVKDEGGRLATVIGLTEMWDYEVAVRADGETSDWPVDASEIEKEKEKTMIGDVVIAIDVSGSQYPEQVGRSILLAETFARKFGAVCARYLMFDEKIVREESTDLGTFKTGPDRVGGGTDFECVFKRLGQIEPCPALLIIVSDMYGSFPDDLPNPRATVVWIDVAGDKSVNVPFGLRVISKEKE